MLKPDRTPWDAYMGTYLPDFHYTEFLPSKLPLFYFRTRRHEIAVVENLIWEARWRYYVQQQPTLSDLQYDRLERRLRKLYGRKVPDGSPLLTVGSDKVSAYPAWVRKTFSTRANR